jgi:hypothetical protein
MPRGIRKNAAGGDGTTTNALGQTGTDVGAGTTTPIKRRTRGAKGRVGRPRGSKNTAIRMHPLRGANYVQVPRDIWNSMLKSHGLLK